MRIHKLHIQPSQVPNTPPPPKKNNLWSRDDLRSRGGILKLSRSPEIYSKKSNPSGYVARRAGTTTIFLLGSFSPHRLFKNSITCNLSDTNILFFILSKYFLQLTCTSECDRRVSGSPLSYTRPGCPYQQGLNQLQIFHILYFYTLTLAPYRDIQRVHTTTLSLVLCKEYVDCPQRDSHAEHYI